MREENWVENIQNISPLDLPGYIEECEFYNRQSGEDLLREIDKKYTGKNGIIYSFVAPAFLNILVNLGNEFNIKQLKQLQKMGLTPDRVVNELKNFSYENEGMSFKTEPNYHEENINKDTTADFDRKKYDNTYKRKKYREKYFDGKKTGEDEYTGERIYDRKKDADKRNYKEATKHTSDVDHIVPLHEKFGELSENIALKDKDIKDIMNIDENYAITNSNLNRSKGDKSNSEYTKETDNLSQKAKNRMIEKQKQANKAIDKKQNEKVIANLKKPEEGKKIITTIGKESASDAGLNTLNSAAGDVIMLGVKASFFEVSDAIKNGAKYKTNQTTKVAAFTYRIKRIIKFVIFKLKDIFSSSIFQFIKGLLLNFAKMIINLFAGIIKNIAKIIINGIGSIIQAIKILATPNSDMTAAQKADAVVKLIASTAVLFLGDITKTALTSIGVPEKFVGIANAFVLAFISAFIGYALDKIDLFGAKIDTRMQRVNEIFNERIDEINKDTEKFVAIARETMRVQKETFNIIKDKVFDALENDNYEELVDGSYEMAEFMDTELEYTDTESFKEYLNQTPIINI